MDNMQKIAIAFLVVKALLTGWSAVSNPDSFDFAKDMTDLTEQVVLLCMEPKKKQDEAE